MQQLASAIHDMFHLGLPVAEKMLRPIIVYVFLVIVLRIFGKRELAQLNPFDLVVLLSLSNTVQNAIIGEDNSVTGGLIGATTLLAINYVVVRFLYSHEKLDRLVEGEPDVLVERGAVVEANLKRELLTRAELESAAHRQGFASLEDVERAVLEPGGAICFIARTPTQDEAKQAELVGRLDAIERRLGQIQGRLESPNFNAGS